MRRLALLLAAGLLVGTGLWLARGERAAAAPVPSGASATGRTASAEPVPAEAVTPAPIPPREVQAAEPPPTAIEVDESILEGVVVVTGRVVALSDGAPVAGAQVGWDTFTETDADGWFEITTGPRTFKWRPGLEVRAAGFCTARCNWDPEELSEPVLVELPEVVPVEGVVRDRYGRPIPGARVRLTSQNLPWSPSPMDRYPDDWRFSAESSDRFEADDAGRFRAPVGIIPFCRFKITASAAGHVRARKEIAGEEPGVPLEVELVLAKEGEATVVSGRVTFNGVPAEALLRWRREGRGGIGLAGQDGEFWIENVEPGRVELTVQIDGEQTLWGLEGSRVELHVADGVETRHDFELAAPMTTISGRITRSDGKPVDVGGLVASYPEMYSYSRGRSEEDGTYTIDVVDVGYLYDVRFRHGSLEVVREGVAAGATGVDFVVPVLGRLRFRAVDATTGQPLGRWFVWWRPASASEFIDVRIFDHAKPDLDSWREVELPIGHIDLVFRADALGYRPVLLRDLLLTVDDVAEAEARMEKGLAIRFVLAEGLEPPPARVVLVEDELHDRVTTFESMGRTYLRGAGNLPHFAINARRLRFERKRTVDIRGLVPGSYRFKAFPDDLVIEPATIELGDVAAEEPIVVRWRRRETR